VSCGQISNLKFYAAEIVLVFEHLHSMGVLYRDLKPENILVQRDGHLVLTDFGFAKRSHETTAKTFCGSLAYMSPEMVKLDGPYGKAVDWYSLGVLIFEMITGNTPFRAPNRKDLQSKILAGKYTIPKFVSLPAANIIKKLLNKRVEKRLGSGPTGAAEVKKHSFFAGIDWTKLLKKQLKPPFIPHIAAEDDTRFFEQRFTSQEVLFTPPDREPAPLSSSLQEKFRGFSFVREDFHET